MINKKYLIIIFIILLGVSFNVNSYATENITTYESSGNYFKEREKLINELKDKKGTIYYSSEDTAKKYIENELLKNIPNTVDSDINKNGFTINISKYNFTTKEELSSVVLEVFDNPENFYIYQGYYSWSTLGSKVVSVTFFYTMNKTDYTKYNESITNIKNRYLKEVNDLKLSTDLDKAIFTNDFLTKNIEYDPLVANNTGSESPFVHTIVGALGNGVAVCDGYSKSFNYLLSLVGVDTALVTSDPMCHAWSQVKINNNWYHVDVTWNDPVGYNPVGFGRYKYLLKSDNAFKTIGKDSNSHHYSWSTLYVSSDTKFDDYKLLRETMTDYLFYKNGNWYYSEKSQKDVKFYKWDENSKQAILTFSVDIGSRVNCVTTDGTYVYLASGKNVYKVDFDGKLKGIVKTLNNDVYSILYNNEEFLWDYYKTELTQGESFKLETEENTNDWEYVVVDDKIEITNYIGNATEITIPSKIDNKEVAYIGLSAFSSCNATKIIIPNTVTYIGEYAFYDCIKLNELTMPNSLTGIGQYAFCNCLELKSVTLPDTLSFIGNAGFGACKSLEEITIPGSMTNIGNFAFSGCSELKSVIIKNGVKVIGKEAFENCSNLTSIVIPNTVENIGDCVFMHCTSLKTITLPNSVSTMGIQIFDGCSSLETVNLSNNITNIDNYMFNKCTSLKNITIPDGVTKFGNEIFSFCSALETVTIPKSVTNLGYNPFRECSKITIKCYKDSEAENYAKNNNIKYELIKEEKYTNIESLTIADMFVFKFEPKTKISTLLTTENFPDINSKYRITVHDSKGKEKLNTENIGSYNVVEVKDLDGNTVTSYTVAIFGDVDGDGQAKIVDSFNMLKDVLNDKPFGEIDKIIRDYDDNGTINMIDAFNFCKAAIKQ